MTRENLSIITCDKKLCAGLIDFGLISVNFLSSLLLLSFVSSLALVNILVKFVKKRGKGPWTSIPMQSLLLSLADRSPTMRDSLSSSSLTTSSSTTSSCSAKTKTTKKVLKMSMKTDIDESEENRRGRRERREIPWLSTTSEREDQLKFKTQTSSRRDFVAWTTLLVAQSNSISAFAGQQQQQTRFTQRFPSLFQPFLGEGTKKTIKTTIVEGRCWALEQTIELGPLETSLRCVVVRLSSGDLWVHNPLAPTDEFFRLVESCSADDGASPPSSASASSRVSSIVVPTYALEHKIFARDAHERWPEAEIWVAPGQFSFPVKNVSNAYVYGTESNVFVLSESNDEAQTATKQPTWKDEINYETLDVGAFNVANSNVQIKECAFFDVKTGMLIVTDALAKIPLTPPVLSSKEKLLLVSKRSTKDPQPDDTPENVLTGWKKTALLVTFFFPEHEELVSPSEVVWTDGWERNFDSISNRLLVPPVVRSLLYAQNPKAVRNWVDRVSARWGESMKIIVPAHWDAPIDANVNEFRNAFRFLEDDRIDPFLDGDLKRGLTPIAKAVLK